MRLVRLALAALPVFALCAAPAQASPENPCPTERIDDRGDESWDSMRDDTREGERVTLLKLFKAAYPEATLVREKLLLTAYAPFYPKNSQPTVGGWGRIQKRFHDELPGIGFSPAGARRVAADDAAGWTELATPPKNLPAEAQPCESRPIALVMIDGAAFRKAHVYGEEFDGDMYGYFEFKP
ncbi:hypothetical protein [Segniliparus rugosus]|uniref:Uncharacterized protein n=1 Tax=Segniliparus rugosus (strain ATCC BAA-974 / DSM 45345 / CCUG 50838 / CIP 108380 / JCM 13579 / CDC 945) TaxID=679197 RepID=E5XVF7_SEGRC|nr:hypothetical protein [Segniliparus rugosus]EFV11671.1 hypothetical protein HMPREF9336_03479 [Segniliparus rugosus ATCC BAA-974]